MRILSLVKRWEHHTASGGYDRLAQEVGGVVVRRQSGQSFGSRIGNRIWRKLSRPKAYLLDYQFQDWLAEWRLLAKARVASPDVVHVLYGDEQLDVLLRRRRWLPCPLVVTFHLPTTRDMVRERFERVQKHLVNGVDAAIVVGRNQLADFQRWFGPERVVYIPHGIDTKRFCPADKRLDQSVVRLVTVGDHMRDLDALHRIIDKCTHLKLPVEFDVVIRERFFPCFSGCDNVRLHAAVSEDQLINLYREADALLLPITDATANNSVLESIACGTPVISTAIGGIPDYVDEASAWLFPKGEVDGIVRLISSACGNREIFSSRRASARAKSLEFDWEQVKKQVVSVYEAVGNGLPVEFERNTPVVGKLTKERFNDA